MEKIAALYKLGIKYFHRYRRRYGFLLAALIFGFAVVTLITSLKDAMYNNVYYAAQSHYAGDIVAVGIEHHIAAFQLGQHEISAVLEAAAAAGINSSHTVYRTLFGENGVVYFNGNALRQKYVVGCDFENEAFLFSKMDFVSFLENETFENWIILSEPVASKLGAAAGDSVVLEVETKWWQKNTGNFIVKGIVQDSSIFGYYKVYIPRLHLNRLLLFNDEDCSTIGFFLENTANAERYRKRMHEVLTGKIQTGPLVYNRDELNIETNQLWEGINVFLYTLPVYLSEISDLMGAMNIITYFLYGMMLLIILVSAIVTYRLIIHERAKEMGIMRAIGFYGADIRLVLWTEALMLGLISLACGFLLAWLLSRASSFISFSWFPSFEIFLKDGRLSVLYLPDTVLTNIILTLSVLAAAVLFPSFSASRKHLPSLLSGESL